MRKTLLEKLLDKVGYWTRFYQAKEFCFYRIPDGPMKTLAEAISFRKFKLASDPSGLNRLYYQFEEKYGILLIESLVNKGYNKLLTKVHPNKKHAQRCSSLNLHVLGMYETLVSSKTNHTNIDPKKKFWFKILT